MTFEHTERLSTTAAPEAVWSLWGDVTSWPAWDPAVEDVRLEDGVATGATGTMLLRGGLEAGLRLEVVDPPTRYVDVLTLGDLTIRIDHVVTAGAEGSEVVVSTTIDGPGADDVGPLVVADAPTALAALAALAEGRPSRAG